jgi:putative tricarboxylic transport membrane protein
MILGPILERGIRRTLVASDGNVAVFFQSPIALVIILITVVLLVSPWLFKNRAGKEHQIDEPQAKKIG